MIVSSLEELEDKLSAYIAGARNIDELYRGRVTRYRRNDQGLTVLDASSDNANVDQWLATHNFPRLLEAWVGGAEVDWNKLHSQPGHLRPRRISLPTYPFARERNWIETSRKKTAKTDATAQALHPLVHTNVSTLHRQSYQSRLSGREAVLSGHGGALPPAACLEMVRAAIANAHPVQGSCFELRNADWGPPIPLTAGAPVTIDVFGSHDSELRYELHSDVLDADGQPRRAVQCRGAAAFVRRSQPVPIDLDRLRAQMRHGELDQVSLPEHGVSPAIRSIRRGERQLLVQLKLPESLLDSESDYVLHPVILDGALRAAAALAGTAQLSRLELLTVLSSSSREMHAWVRYTRGSRPGDSSPKLDVDLIDPQGNIAIRLKALTFASVQTAQTAAPGSDEFVQLLETIYRRPAEAEFTRLLEEIL